MAQYLNVEDNTCNVFADQYGSDFHMCHVLRQLLLCANIFAHNAECKLEISCYVLIHSVILVYHWIDEAFFNKRFPTPVRNHGFAPAEVSIF